MRRAVKPVAQVLSLPWSAQAPVAIHAGQHKQAHHLKFDVAHLAAQLSRRREPYVSLCSTDAYPFVVGLLAAWHVGKTVTLPGHPGAMAASDQAVWVGDQGPASAIEIRLNQPEVALVARAAPPKPALIMMTSGSTGAPQEVPKSFEQIDAEVATLEATFGEATQDALVLGTVSQQHLYGFLFRVAWPLATGRAFVSESSLFPEAWFEETARHAKVAWVSSPAFYRRLWADLPWQLVSERVCRAFSSGGVLADEVGERMTKWLGQAVTEVFGSTETGGVATRQGSALWRPFSTVQVERLPDGALRVASAHLPSEDWQVMNDAIEGDQAGFRLLGRLDRVVKLEDKRVSLPDVEQGLQASPLVAEAKVVLLDSGPRHELGAAVVLSAEGMLFLNQNGRAALTAALKKTLPAHVPAIAAIRRFRFMSSLRSDAQGKVTWASLRALFAQPRALLPQVVAVKRSADAVMLTLEVEADLAAFEGHFPQAPVLPGVAQLDWAVRLAREHVPMPPLPFLRLEAVKFQRVIQPGGLLELTLQWSTVKSRLSFAYASASGGCSSGRVVFAAAGGT